MRRFKQLFTILFFFHFLLSNNVSFAQGKVDVSWGPEYKQGRHNWLKYFIGHDAEGFYVLRNEKDGYLLEKYSNKTLTKIFSNQFELPKRGRHDFSLMDIYRIDGQMLVFSYDYDKKERRASIYVQELSDKGILNPKYKQLDEVIHDERKQSSSFSIRLSPDSSNFLIYRNLDFDKHSNEELVFKVFDKSLNLLWEKSIELPYRDDVVSLSQVRLGNDGQVYMQSAKVPDRKRGEKKVRKIQNTKYSVFAYYPDSDDFRQYEISLGIKNWISDMRYTINVDGDVIVTGFYSDEDAYTMDGVFYLKIDKNDKRIVAQNMKKFDKEFLLNFMKEKHVEKGNKDLGVFDLDAPVLRSDGGIMQVAEYYRYYVTTTRDANGNTTTTHHYVYNDLLVANFDPNGKIEWVAVVPKKQHTKNDGGYYSSYALGLKDDKLLFVFNDHPKNIVQYEKNHLKLKTMTNAKGAVTMLTEVNSDGDVRRSPLFEAKDLKTILRPKKHYNIGNGKFLVYGVKGKKDKFGKLDFSNY